MPQRLEQCLRRRGCPVARALLAWESNFHHLPLAADQEASRLVGERQSLQEELDRVGRVRRSTTTGGGREGGGGVVRRIEVHTFTALIGNYLSFFKCSQESL